MMASLFEKIKHRNHLYVFYKGDLIYKQFLKEDGTKSESSVLFPGNGWLPAKIINDEDEKMKQEELEKNVG